MNDVIIVGAGPVGMMLASELRLGGVDVLIVERLGAPTGLSKALGVTGRGEDYLAMRGLLDSFRRRAPPAPAANLMHFGLIPLDIRKTPLSAKGIFVPQAITEEILEERARELGATIRRGVTVNGLTQDSDGVTLDTTDPTGGNATTHLRARFVVGCDGARSGVRSRVGIDFPGLDPTSILRLGDVQVDTPHAHPFFVPLGDGWLRVVAMEPIQEGFDHTAPMTLDELSQSIKRVYRIDVPLRSARWLSRFTDASRLASSFRKGRVFVAGDAAHTHLPAGGPGLLTGFGDALNLGWKLAAVIRGRAPERTLDSYDLERRAVAQRVLHHTRAQGRITSPDQGSVAMRAIMTELVTMAPVVEHLLRMLWQLDTAYPVINGQPGARTGEFAEEAVPFLHEGRWVAMQTRPVFDSRVDALSAKVVSVSKLEGVNASAILVRPDGHVAWAGDSMADPGLALTVAAWSDHDTMSLKDSRANHRA